MASTSVPVAPSGNQPCDYCHQKPKFSNHSYCSKTCAGQAAALCNHCHKKPKFQGFDYCGKNCAAQANPGGKTAKIGGPGAAASQPVSSSGGKTTYSRGAAAASQQPPQAAQAFDPVQLAKLVVQHIPQVTQPFLGPNAAQAVAAGATAAVNALGGPMGINQARAVPQQQPLSNNPFLGGMPATQQNLNNNGGTSAASSNAHPAAHHPKLHLSTGNHHQQAADNIECLISGCRKPVHVDAKGVKTSDYCSLRHREEAVTSGLRSPCIMCLSYPQSDEDYFCSRACREESLNKMLEYDDYDDDETVVSESELN